MTYLRGAVLEDPEFASRPLPGRALRRGLGYLLANARRHNFERGRRTGRLRAGLVLIEAVK